MSCPQIWNIEKEKDRDKEKLGRQASEAQREKELERERKNKRKHFLLEVEQYEICSGGMLAATRVKMSDREKRVNKNPSDIPSIKRVTRKFLDVLRNSRAKRRQRNAQKKCAARAKLLFC